MKDSIPNLNTIFLPNHIKSLKFRGLVLRRSQFLHPNTHFAAFFENYKICNPLHRFNFKISAKLRETFFFDSRLKDPISKPFRLTENPRKRKTKTNLCYQRSRDPSAFRREAEVLPQSYGRRLTSGASVLENNVSGSGRGNTAEGATVSNGDTHCATAR